MPVSDARVGSLKVTITVVLALIFTIVQLPDPIQHARPELLLLLVIYWSLSAPRLAGLTFAWLCGLAVDLLAGPIKFQLRMRIFPIWHQTLTVFMLLALYEFLVFWIDGIIGPAITTWMRWLPVLTSALLWPVLVAVLDTWNRRSR